MFNDAVATYDHLVNPTGGYVWTHDAAIEEIDRAYRSWVVERVNAAVDDAVALLRMEVST